jgi:asparagine synthase (glutamine-hydrolysing)
MHLVSSNEIKNNIIVMCGIVCAFDLKQNSETLRPQVLEMSK